MGKTLCFKINKVHKNSTSNLQKKIQWTNEEDKILIDVSNKMKRNKWRYASSLLKNKTSFQCYLRYKIVNPFIRKGRWCSEEDEKLIKLIGLFGKSWKLISKILKNRSSKQIRNRYEDHLNKKIMTKTSQKSEEYFMKNNLEVIYQGEQDLSIFLPNNSIKKNNLKRIKVNNCSRKNSLLNSKLIKKKFSQDFHSSRFDRDNNISKITNDNSESIICSEFSSESMEIRSQNSIVIKFKKIIHENVIGFDNIPQTSKNSISNSLSNINICDDFNSGRFIDNYLNKGNLVIKYGQKLKQNYILNNLNSFHDYNTLDIFEEKKQNIFLNYIKDCL